MKNSFVLVFLALLLLNCSKDNSKNETPLDLLLGVWYVNEHINNNGENPVVSDCEKMDERIFYEDGTFLFSYHVESSGIPCFKDGEETGTWQRTENTLTIHYDDFDPNGPNEMDFEIVNLNEDELRWRLIIPESDYDRTTILIK
ncbi:lipocalin family protein [Altibacter sp. HG106]|uniref:lipocalin family protein n=1 Tax=Altibacter sp. HG106 TaxID=3023937 RepID=UPI0023505525|nr:lipocalin family protein [Altibacter sp. HG106]MDC7995510.1 lipocalin family protein [Altibacter sp. HG106]